MTAVEDAVDFACELVDVPDRIAVCAVVDGVGAARRVVPLAAVLAGSSVAARIKHTVR